MGNTLQINLITFVAMELHEEPVFVDGISIQSSLSGEFRVCRPKSVIIPNTTDAVLKMIVM